MLSSCRKPLAAAMLAILYLGAQPQRLRAVGKFNVDHRHRR